MSHTVRRHTRRTRSGRTVPVRQHRAGDPASAQKRRHAFERRVERERAAARAQELRDRQAGEALYEPSAGRKTRTPGERKRKRGPKPARAKRHAKKALRLWRRHKVKALLFAGLALGELGAWAAARGVSGARNAVRRIRKAKRRKGKR